MTRADTKITEITLVKTDAQHRAYLAEVERLAADDPPPGTPKGDRLELLAKLVEDYEKSRYPFDLPDPIAAIRFRMEEQGLQQKDVASLFGGKNRVSEVLAGKRPLTLTMIRSVAAALHIPLAVLMGEPGKASRAGEARKGYRVRGR